MLGLTYKDNFSRVFDYTGDFEAFVIPKNATMLHIWAIGAGGPGGFGFSRAAGTAGGGGGGGATGAIVTMLVPTRFLPPTLYIYAGRGTGTTEGRTWVSFRRYDGPNNVIADSLLMAQIGNGGGPGTAIAAGSAGTPGSYNAPSNLYAGLGTLTITAGQGGSAGGAQTGQAGLINSAFSGGMPFTGGAGGAGCTTTDFAGGSINPNSNAQQQSGITLAGGGNVFGIYDGLNGLQFEEPFTCYGGSGGGSNNTGTGGKGGDGAIGCGGGGGGAGVTGGAGGRGGNGRVVITWF
jgi:hypothetical protein